MDSSTNVLVHFCVILAEVVPVIDPVGGFPDAFIQHWQVGARKLGDSGAALLESCRESVAATLTFFVAVNLWIEDR